MQDDKQPDVTLSDLDNSPPNVPASGGDVEVSPEVLRSRWVKELDQNYALKEEISELKARLAEANSNADTKAELNALMFPTARLAFKFLFAYSGAVFLLIFLNALGIFKIELDVEVMKFLVGSTAVTVVGLVGMVLTGVFVGARK